MELSNLTRERITEFISSGKRFDGRGLLDYREISIETGISKNAEGSARVRIGKTEVVAGVKMDVSTPYADSEEAGNLIIGMELMPLSSPRFEPGPPKIEAIEIARIVDRGVRESGFLDFNKLCIKKGEKVWSIYVDLFSMNDDGNLMDAAALATIAALKSARIPVYDEKAERVKFGEWTDKKLPLTETVPLTMTFHKVGTNLLVDPVCEEEESSETRMIIAISKEGKEIFVNALQKGNETPLTKEDVFTIIDSASVVWKQLNSKIQETFHV